jgi:hypothetical protein
MRAKDLAQHRLAVEDFRDRFQELMAVMERDEPQGLPATRRREAEVARLRRAVSEASGPASEAFARFGSEVAWRWRGQIARLNPAGAWNNIFERVPMISPDIIVDACSQLIGGLIAREKAAQAEERSLAGRLARFFSFPSRVHAMTAKFAGPSLGKVAFAATVVAQILIGLFVTVLGTLIAVFLSMRLGWAR